MVQINGLQMNCATLGVDKDVLLIYSENGVIGKINMIFIEDIIINGYIPKYDAPSYNKIFEDMNFHGFNI